MIFFLFLLGCTKTAEYCVERINSNGEVISAHVTKRITDNKCEYNDEKYKMDDIALGCGEYWAYGEEGDLSENDLALCDHCNPLKKIPVQDCEAWYEYDTGAAYK